MLAFYFLSRNSVLDFVAIYPSLGASSNTCSNTCISLFLPVTRDGCHKTGSVSPVQRRECDMCARKANIISTVIKLLLLNAAGVKRYLQMDIRASVGERFWRIMVLSSSLSEHISLRECLLRRLQHTRLLADEEKRTGRWWLFPPIHQRVHCSTRRFLALSLNTRRRISRRRTIEHLKWLTSRSL